MLNRKRSTGVVTIYIDVFIGEGELEGVLDDVFVEFVVEE